MVGFARAIRGRSRMSDHFRHRHPEPREGSKGEIRACAWILRTAQNDDHGSDAELPDTAGIAEHSLCCLRCLL